MAGGGGVGIVGGEQLVAFCRYRDKPLERATRIYNGMVEAAVQPADAAQMIERWFRDYAGSGTAVVERTVDRALRAGLRSHRLTYAVGLRLAQLERKRRAAEQARELERRRQKRRRR